MARALECGGLGAFKGRLWGKPGAGKHSSSASGELEPQTSSSKAHYSGLYIHDDAKTSTAV